MALVTKTVKGRKYLYSQRSYREGGKVKTESLYIGPILLRIVPALLSMFYSETGHSYAAKLAKYGKGKQRESHNVHRSSQIARNKIAELDRIYGVDRSSRESFTATRARMAPEVFQEFSRAERHVLGEHHAVRQAENKPAAKSKEMVAFGERLDKQQAAKTATASSPAPSAAAPDQQSEQSPSDAPSTAS